MKKILLILTLFICGSLTSQIAVFHPVQVPGDQVETFEKIQTEYVPVSYTHLTLPTT